MASIRINCRESQNDAKRDLFLDARMRAKYVRRPLGLWPARIATFSYAKVVIMFLA